MSLKDRLSRLSPFSPLANKVKLKSMSQIGMGIGALLLILFLVAVVMTKQHQHEEITQDQKSDKNEAAKFESITADFSDDDTRSALHTEQSSLDSLQQEVDTLKNALKTQNDLLTNQQKQSQVQQDAEAKTLADLRSSMGGQLGTPHLTRAQVASNLSALDVDNASADSQNNQSQLSSATLPAGSIAIQPQLVGGLQRFDQSWSDPNAEENEEDSYVPAGTFVQAILLGGADASASVNAQSNTSPIIFRLSGDAIEPNHKKAPIKDCVVIAETYGDISSERGEVRLNRISCNKSDGTVLDIPIKGTVYDIGGKEGIRGTPVMRNGKILFYSAASGFASGIGSAAQNEQTTNSISPLGSTTTVSPGKTFAYGIYGGMNTGMGKLADYYIQRADQYHPIIELNAGAKVDVVFLEGFSLKSSVNQEEDKPQSTQPNSDSAAVSRIIAQSTANNTDANSSTDQPDINQTQNNAGALS